MQFIITEATNKGLIGVSLPLEVTGTTQTILGKDYPIRQFGGGILVVATEDEMLVLRQVKEIVTPVTLIKDPKDLRINKEIDIFFATREIRLNLGTGNLTEEFGVTYDAVYRFLLKEWETVQVAFPEQGSFPMEQAEGTNNYCFLRNWNWFADYTLALKGGCWSRKDNNGRFI